MRTVLGLTMLAGLLAVALMSGAGYWGGELLNRG